jgi:hypothetical protein
MPLARGTPRTDPGERYRTRLLPWVLTHSLLPYLDGLTLQGSPVQCPALVSSRSIPLGQSPSIHPLRHTLVVTHLVRGLLGYYAAVRLPVSVHHGRVLLKVLHTDLITLMPDTGPPHSRANNFHACMRSPTPPSPHIPRHIRTQYVAFCDLEAHRHLVSNLLRGSILSLHFPLSTLH